MRFCGYSDVQDFLRLREVCEELLGPLRPVDEANESPSPDAHVKLYTSDISQTAGGAKKVVCLPESGDERPVAGVLNVICRVTCSAKEDMLSNICRHADHPSNFLASLMGHACFLLIMDMAKSLLLYAMHVFSSILKPEDV